MNAAGSGLFRAAGFVIGGAQETWGPARVNPVKLAIWPHFRRTGKIVLKYTRQTLSWPLICLLSRPPSCVSCYVLSTYFNHPVLATHAQKQKLLSSYQPLKITISPLIRPLCTSDKHLFCYYIATDRRIISNRLNGALSYHKPREFFTSHCHYNSKVKKYLFHIHFRSTNLRLRT
jgi:hypothetical protein